LKPSLGVSFPKARAILAGVSLVEEAKQTSSVLAKKQSMNRAFAFPVTPDEAP
jgi:hypothetical protein